MESVSLLVVSSVEVLLEDVIEFGITNLVHGSVLGVENSYAGFGAREFALE